MSDEIVKSVLLLDTERMDSFMSCACMRLSVAPLGMCADGTLRNYLDGSWPRQPMADLVISAQTDGTSEQSSYGWRVEYRNAYSVDLQRAEEMVRLLRKIERGMAKIEREFGYCESFGAYVARVAKVLGITTFGWRAEDGERSFAYSDSRYRWTDAAGFGSHVESVCRAYRAEREKTSC